MKIKDFGGTHHCGMPELNLEEAKIKEYQVAQFICKDLHELLVKELEKSNYFKTGDKSTKGLPVELNSLYGDFATLEKTVFKRFK